MNKKIILLPFLTVALLTGCGNEKKPVEKKPWEEELTEGESTIAQVKAGKVGEYYKVRGTVVWNSGSTLAIYRDGQFLYCYNFSSDTSKTSNEDLGEHALGSYVELYGKTSEFSGSIQLTAYVNSKYDVDAKCTTIAAVGEEVNPVAISDPADLANKKAAGMLAKIELVAKADYTIPSTALSSDLYMDFTMTDAKNTALAVKVEKFLPAEDIANLAGTINQGDKLEFVGILAATSSGSCRMVLGQGSSYTVKEAKQWAEPTSVTVTSEGSATSVKVNETLQLSAVVAPADAKQKVTWSSSDETKATVDATGKVTGVAAGSVVITATAKEGVAGTFNLTVKAAEAHTYAALEKFTFTSSLTKYEVYDATKMDEFIKASSDKTTAESAFTGHAINSPATNTLIGANGGSGDTAWSDYNLLKLGSSKAASNITFNFKDGTKVGKVVISAAGWPSKTCNLTVGGSAEQQITSGTAATFKDASCYQEFTFTFNATASVEFVASLCVCIKSIQFYSIAD